MDFICDPSDQAKLIIRKWLEPVPGIYATAEFVESPEPWVVSSSSPNASVHLMAWTGDVPLLADGAESSSIGRGFIRIVSRTPTWNAP